MWGNSKHYCHLNESNKSKYQGGKGSSNLCEKKGSDINRQVRIYYRKSSAQKDDVSIGKRQDERNLRGKKSNQRFTAKLAKRCVL